MLIVSNPIPTRIRAPFLSGLHAQRATVKASVKRRRFSKEARDRWWGEDVPHGLGRPDGTHLQLEIQELAPTCTLLPGPQNSQKPMAEPRTQ